MAAWMAALAALATMTGAISAPHAGVGVRAERLAEEALATLNLARAHPDAYVAELRAYRARFRGRMVRLASNDTELETEEGVAPVDGAIALLARTLAESPLGQSALLAAAAADLAHGQALDGSTGHGAGASAPEARSLRHGGGAQVAEVIAYGAVDGADAIRQLIVDDGVAGRDHRAILFEPALRFAGAACGPHPAWGSICVIELSATADGR